MHRLICEVVDNSIEEILVGYGTRIEVILNGDNSVTVIDDGRGIPVEINPVTNKSFLETIMTSLSVWGNCGSDDVYKVKGDLHGVGIAVVNPLSEWVEITVWREGYRYNQRYEKGVAVTPLRVYASSEEITGTNNLEVREIVDAIVGEGLNQYLQQHPNLVNRIAS